MFRTFPRIIDLTRAHHDERAKICPVSAPDLVNGPDFVRDSEIRSVKWTARWLNFSQPGWDLFSGPVALQRKLWVDRTETILSRPSTPPFAAVGRTFTASSSPSSCYVSWTPADRDGESTDDRMLVIPLSSSEESLIFTDQ